MKNQAGFGIIEVIVAMSLFLMVAAVGATTVIGSFSSNRLGEEETAATVYAQAGLEAVRSIKNQGWVTLLSTDCNSGCGVGIVDGIWNWSGTNNSLGKYNRQIKVTPVYRDSNGNMVTSGGSEDPYTRKIESTVTWDFSIARTNTVSLSTYLTDFNKPVPLASGILVYGDSSGFPKYRLYHDYLGTFEEEAPIETSSTGQYFVVRTSPTKSEAVAGYVTSTGVLNVLCYDGSQWSSEWSETVGGTGSTRRFDISYETGSGDVIVLYSTGQENSNELAYRVKRGDELCGNANWTDDASLDPVRTSGVVHWVKMAWDKRAGQNLIAATWADTNSDLSAMVWDGSSWTNEPSSATETSLEIISSSQDVEDFDLEFESASGDILLVWANSSGTNKKTGVRYRTCNGGISACNWGMVTTPQVFTYDATNLDISAHPDTNEIVFASIGNKGGKLQAGYWNGSSWTNNANLDNSVETPLVGTKLVSTGWLVNGSISRSVIVYNDRNETDLGYYIGNQGNFTAQPDYPSNPSFSRPQKWYEIQMNPLRKDQLMVGISDNNSDLFSKKLKLTAPSTFTWTDVDGSALETDLAQASSGPFYFTYRRI